MKDIRVIASEEPESLNACVENLPSHDHAEQGEQLNFLDLHVATASRFTMTNTRGKNRNSVLNMIS